MALRGGSPVAALRAVVADTLAADEPVAFRRDFTPEAETAGVVEAEFNEEPAEAQAKGIGTVAERRQQAKLRGYTGNSCSECGNFTMVRNGTCEKCETCGSTSGCS
jgi:ribonucleoside-diphosphate reductase alpha chain